MPETSSLKQNLPLEEEPSTNDFSEYLQIFINNLWVILAVTGLVAVCSVIYYSTLPDLYTANVKILVEKMDNPRTSYQEITMSAFRGEDDYYGTQIAILTGRKIASTVESEIGTSDYNLQAMRLIKTRILKLSVTHRNPEMAAKVANKYAEVYVKESANENLFMARQILQWIPEDTDTAVGANNVAAPLEGFNKKEYANSLASVGSDPAIQKMRIAKIEIESQIQEMSQRYKPQHPIMKELNDKLNYMDNEIQSRTSRILNNIKASLKENIGATNVKILEEATIPRSPSSPKRFKGVFFNTFLGFFLSVLGVILFEYVNQRIRTERDFHRSIHVPFLGYIPFAKEFLKKKGQAAFTTNSPSLIDVWHKNSILSDAVASVRTHILFSTPYEKSKLILLTSAVPNEGKTTVSILLALSLSTLGKKVLLVDGDLRRPFLHSYLGLKKDKGLTDFLVGSADLPEVIRQVPGSTLSIVVGGNKTLNPSELLSSDRFQAFLEGVSGLFDKVVIDVPPVLYIPDGLIVAKHMHACVLICGAGMVQKKVVKSIVEKFESIGHPFIGAVINRADYEKEGYRYKYFSHYKNYYSQK